MVCRLSQVSVFVCGSHFNVCDSVTIASGYVFLVFVVTFLYLA